MHVASSSFLSLRTALRYDPGGKPSCKSFNPVAILETSTTIERPVQEIEKPLPSSSHCKKP
ncbi:hypothetical protein CA54_20800 [Symmachiella macrocystis]|uniref:Uncharacterized protein n=1 Tax=Symmachiella macrocystis TaxID=2527985 RepID=A0A5C6BND3_9PLAN|nr:hypothetical protein CA54_20800 [Symmachiella macrocystis]